MEALALFQDALQFKLLLLVVVCAFYGQGRTVAGAQPRVATADVIIANDNSAGGGSDGVGFVTANVSTIGHCCLRAAMRDSR